MNFNAKLISEISSTKLDLSICANYEMTVHHEKVIKALRHTTLQWLEFRSNYQKKLKWLLIDCTATLRTRRASIFRTRHQITQGKLSWLLVDCDDTSKDRNASTFYGHVSCHQTMQGKKHQEAFLVRQDLHGFPPTRDGRA
jgi:hypothetical protein